MYPAYVVARMNPEPNLVIVIFKALRTNVLLGLKSIQQRPTTVSLVLFTTNNNTFTLAVRKITIRSRAIFASNVKQTIG